jgi:hypothetical protein
MLGSELLCDLQLFVRRRGRDDGRARCNGELQAKTVQVNASVKVNAFIIHKMFIGPRYGQVKATECDRCLNAYEGM